MVPLAELPPPLDELEFVALLDAATELLAALVDPLPLALLLFELPELLLLDPELELVPQAVNDSATKTATPAVANVFFVTNKPPSTDYKIVQRTLNT